MIRGIKFGGVATVGEKVEKIGQKSGKPYWQVTVGGFGWVHQFFVTQEQYAACPPEGQEVDFAGYMIQTRDNIEARLEQIGARGTVHKQRQAS